MADQTIGTGTITVDGSQEPYASMSPGDTLYITGEGAGSPRDHLEFENFDAGGTIWIVNAGDVYIDGAEEGRFACITFGNCDDMHLAGIGSGREFGFHCSGHSGTGVRIHECSTDIEVEHVYVDSGWEESGDDFAQGISCVSKTDDDNYSPGFEGDNINIHDCVLVGCSEAMYLGKIAGGDGVPLNNLVVQHMYIYWTPVDAIGLQQVITATIRDNRIDQAGLDPPEGQTGGGVIVYDGCDDITITRNWITNAVKGVYCDNHDGPVYVRYNLVEDMSSHGVQFATAGQGDYVEGNTVVESGGDGIKTTATGTGTCRSNIACGSTGADVNSGWGTVTNNVTGTVGDQNFRASDPLRHLTVTSPAQEAAHDGSDCGWKQDNG